MARYEEIADDLRRRISAGEWKPGENLLGYAELTRAYRVGRTVIRAALAELEADGLILVAKRRGITVRDRGTRRRIQRGQTVTRDPARGYVMPAAANPYEPWQTHGRPRRSVEPIPPRPAELLGVEAGTPVLRRRRVTSPAGEPPFQLVDTWIHPRGVEDAPQVAEASTGPGGYLDQLEEAGHGPITWVEYTRARMPTPDEAKVLGISTAVPVLEIARVGKSAATKAPVEVTVCVIPSDRVELVTPLRRAPSARWKHPDTREDG